MFCARDVMVSPYFVPKTLHADPKQRKSEVTIGIRNDENFQRVWGLYNRHDMQCGEQCEAGKDPLSCASEIFDHFMKEKMEQYRRCHSWVRQDRFI